MTTISLDSTYQFQQALELELGRKSFDMEMLTRSAEKQVRERGMKFETDRDLSVALSPLILAPDDLLTIQRICEQLHSIVELAIDWIMESRSRLDSYFADHSRVVPYLTKTRGSSTWQVLSRYDAIISATGELKIIELNTACPAGFFHASGMAEITNDILRVVDRQLASSYTMRGAIPRDALVNELLAVEEAAQIEHGLIALLNDENGLQNELALLAAQFNNMGREAEIVPASEIEFQEGKAVWRGRPLSLSFNKVRVSTAESPNHKWSHGFEERYGGFLESTTAGAFASVNGMVGLTLAEDKGMLAVLHEPEFRQTLSVDQCGFIDEHVLPTARLSDQVVNWKQQPVDLRTTAYDDPDLFVVKPANEGRGFGLVVGRHAAAHEWRQACTLDPTLPKVVQESVMPATIRVSRLQGHETDVANMYLTLGLAMLRGRFQGILSRISTHPVTNISRSGMVQAVFTASGQP